jgi:hypothetical protein
MTADNTQDIRRRPDGSIDTSHYMAQGRQARSQAAHRLFSRLKQKATDARPDFAQAVTPRPVVQNPA